MLLKIIIYLCKMCRFQDSVFQWLTRSMAPCIETNFIRRLWVFISGFVFSIECFLYFELYYQISILSSIYNSGVLLLLCFLNFTYQMFKSCIIRPHFGTLPFSFFSPEHMFCMMVSGGRRTSLFYYCCLTYEVLLSKAK